MKKSEAITYIGLAYDKYRDAHPKARGISPKNIFENLADLCEEDYRGLCKALNAKCSGGHTDPLECAGVFSDAVNTAMNWMEKEWEKRDEQG